MGCLLPKVWNEDYSTSKNKTSLFSQFRLSPKIIFISLIGRTQQSAISADKEISMNDPNEEVPGHHHEKPVHIIVNGKQKDWFEKEISFEEVVSLAYEGKPPSGPDWVFTVTYYYRGHGGRPGTMVAGEKIHVKDGMVFNVTATNKS
jgi:hypothetical protein